MDAIDSRTNRNHRAQNKPRYENVLVYLYPYECSLLHVENVLSAFGGIDYVRTQVWTNVPNVSTGTVIVGMCRSKDISRFLNINGFQCKVWHKDQPIVCDICRGSHKAASFPLRGKCRNCHESGHFAHDCLKDDQC